MSLSSRIGVQISGNYTLPLDLANKVCELLRTVSLDLGSGTGADQADLIWHAQRTLAPSATQDLDLAGSLIDVLTGTPVTFARIKALVVIAAPGNANNVNVTRPASNGVPLFLAAGDGIAVKPKGCFLWVAPDAAGVAVTPGTGDLISFTNSGVGTPVTWDVVILGASA